MLLSNFRLKAYFVIFHILFFISKLTSLAKKSQKSILKANVIYNVIEIQFSKNYRTYQKTYEDDHGSVKSVVHGCEAYRLAFGAGRISSKIQANS